MAEVPKPANDDEHEFERLLHDQEEAEQHEPPGDWRIEDWLAFVLFWVLAAVVFLQFFTRYVLNDSLAWTEEIARYLLMAVTFVGCALAARRGTHIAVEFLLHALPERARRWFRLVVGLASLTLFTVLAVLCWQVADAMMYQPMVVIDWPLGIVYYAVLVGLVATALRYGLHLRDTWRSGEIARIADPSEGRGL